MLHFTYLVKNKTKNLRTIRFPYARLTAILDVATAVNNKFKIIAEKISIFLFVGIITLYFEHIQKIYLFK